MSIANKFKLILTVSLLLITFVSFGQSNGKFKVVLDAGHGGKDFGAIHHGFVEKKIALNVALKVGEILEKDADVELIYTRKTDVFIELRERANIANRANANLFISIHCNGSKSYDAYGTETFVMGLSRSATNLEVAKKENEVIELEADYKVNYKGFDPKSPESLIGLTLVQEEFLEQSITLASNIQDAFTNKLKRKNRGVKQAPIWVLDATVMPSVLVELGFLSNRSEGAYLDTEKGQDELARSIAQAILTYKKDYFGGAMINVDAVALKKQAIETPKTTPAKAESTIPAKTEATIPVSEANDKGVLFKVQISASSKKLDLIPSNFNGLSTISIASEGNLHRYMYGGTGSYETAKEQLQEAKSKGYKEAFLIAFKNGKKISLQEALK